MFHFKLLDCYTGSQFIPVNQVDWLTGFFLQDISLNKVVVVTVIIIVIIVKSGTGKIWVSDKINPHDLPHSDWMYFLTTVFQLSKFFPSYLQHLTFQQVYKAVQNYLHFLILSLLQRWQGNSLSKMPLYYYNSHVCFLLKSNKTE